MKQVLLALSWGYRKRIVVLFDMKQILPILKNWRYVCVIEKDVSLKASPMFCEFYL